MGHTAIRVRENIEIDTFDYKRPKGKSIAHKWITIEKAVYISLDIETGGKNCGITQLSAQIFRMVQHNSKLTSEIERECFVEYAMPSKHSIWDERLFQIHGLHRDRPHIKEADDIPEIWRRFCILEGTVRRKSKLDTSKRHKTIESQCNGKDICIEMEAEELYKLILQYYLLVIETARQKSLVGCEIRN